MLSLAEGYRSTEPTRGGGVIHGSASEAILTVMVAARDKFLRQATEHLSESDAKEEEMWRLRSQMAARGSEMSHSSTKKATQVLGVRYVAVPASSYPMTGAAVASAIESCRAEGLYPFCPTATLGTTDTCAVDDFNGIALVVNSASSDDIWVHVDAAYAGSALVLPEYQHIAATFTTFHSFNFNPG